MTNVSFVSWTRPALGLSIPSTEPGIMSNLNTSVGIRTMTSFHIPIWVTWGSQPKARGSLRTTLPRCTTTTFLLDPGGGDHRMSGSGSALSCYTFLIKAARHKTETDQAFQEVYVFGSEGLIWIQPYCSRLSSVTGLSRLQRRLHP
jgi:hypothetical protein